MLGISASARGPLCYAVPTVEVRVTATSHAKQTAHSARYGSAGAPLIDEGWQRALLARSKRCALNCPVQYPNVTTLVLALQMTDKFASISDTPEWKALQDHVAVIDKTWVHAMHRCMGR